MVELDGGCLMVFTWKHTANDAKMRLVASGFASCRPLGSGGSAKTFDEANRSREVLGGRVNS